MDGAARPSARVAEHASVLEPGARAVLVIAHPGHELCVHGWVERVRPEVYVLTDGSGPAGRPRLAATSRTLQRAGGRAGAVYGPFADRELYDAVIDRRHGLLVDLVARLSDRLIRGGIDHAVGDAAEGYNPTHDVCRLLLNSAVAVACRAGGRPVANFDFAIMQHPDDGARRDACRLVLDENAFHRKARAAADYTALESDVTMALGAFGADAFRVEALRPVTGDPWRPALPMDPPVYEPYGETRVAAGAYTRVLRYREHVLPLADALRAFVETRG